MKRKLEEKDRQIEALQKRLKKGSGKYSDDSKGGGKEGKGKGKKEGDGRNMPFSIRGQHSVHLGQNLCYDFSSWLHGRRAREGLSQRFAHLLVLLGCQRMAVLQVWETQCHM